MNNVMTLEIEEVAHTIESLTEELTLTQHTVDRFMYSLSHEFRGPIKSISGLVNLLAQRTNSDEEKDSIHCLTQIVSKLDFVLDQLKADLIIKTEQNKAILIEDEVKRVIRLYETALDEKGIEVTVESSQRSVFYIDTERFSMVLQNLIANAIDQADMTKADRTIMIGIEAGEEQCMITMAENGLGIEADNLQSLFEPFSHSAQTSQVDGVGLYMAKSVLKKMGGKIAVATCHGFGTVFTIEIPNQKESK